MVERPLRQSTRRSWTGHSQEGSAVLGAGGLAGRRCVVGKRVAGRVSSLLIVVGLIAMAGWKWAIAVLVVG